MFFLYLFQALQLHDYLYFLQNIKTCRLYQAKTQPYLLLPCPILTRYHNPPLNGKIQIKDIYGFYFNREDLKGRYSSVSSMSSIINMHI